jgi:purine nucleosidase
MTLIHLDTDIGGDIDDLSALAMLLGWPDVELTGITTVADDGGRRAGYARRALQLAGRGSIPIAAGVDVASGRFPYPLRFPPEEEFWGTQVDPLPGPADQAVELLRHSIAMGADVVAVGPYSNLAELEARYPGSLAAARLVVMGGHPFPPRKGFPPWGPADDFNVQVDVSAAEVVLRQSSPTLVPLSVTVETALRRSFLPTVREAGPLGELLARQAEAQARYEQNEEHWGRSCPGLPDDTMAFLHDPLACAVALGWRDGIRMETLSLAWERRDGLLHMRQEQDGRQLPVVVGIDGPAFSSKWLSSIRTRSQLA